MLKDVLFYIPTKDEAEKQLVKAVTTLAPNVNIKTCRDAESLRSALLRRENGVSVVVILAATKEDLLGVMGARNLLYDFRLILILPDNDELSVNMGYSLWPRFISYSDRDFFDVAAVLQKMVGNLPHLEETRGGSSRWA